MMPKINILDKSVYSLIAAGEVIDKPSSVVKELMENAIDAGSTMISVEVKDGGTTFISVSDNGCGMQQEDMKIAFLPHTTSKISTVDDLYNIGTLGFRGEALSTITAVSKVTMISKTHDANCGNIIKINGGEVEKMEPIGCPDGTTVISEDLFYNIPARKKFLRKPRLEEGDITNIVARIILSHPDISIKYVADGKIVYNSSGNGLFDAIYSVYGKSVVNNLIQVHFTRNNIKVDGYIGKVAFTKPNRTYQTIIINGRYVINQTISTAIFKAYESYIMKNNFPFYVLNMTIDNNKVDVNVHPNKLDVKFDKPNEIFELFVVEISKILLDSISIDNINKTNSQDEMSSPELDLSNLRVVSENEGVEYDTKADTKNNELSRPVEVDITSNDLYNYKPSINDTTTAFNSKLDSYFNDGKLELNSPSEMNSALNEAIYSKEVSQQSIKFVEDNYVVPKLSESKIVGTIFDTYIILEKGEYVYFIDQHAGHERILYDKLVEQLQDSQMYSQPLFIPYLLNVSDQEYSFLSDNIDVLLELGFDIAEFGKNTFRISAVPCVVETISLKTFFEEVLSNINNSKLKLDNATILKDYLAKTACKHAIKGNDKLDISQVEYLIAKLDETPILLCPHGRPIVLKVTKSEIEKWFKRIV